MAKEYIERDAAINRLQTVSMPDDPYSKGIQRGVEHAIDVIKEAPAADVVEVVRCKDCVKRKTQHCSMYYESDDEQYSWEVDDDFCSQGERRDDNAAD